MTSKVNLKNPDFRWTSKVLKICLIYFIIIGVIFGWYGYFCLGDNYVNELFMLRSSFDGK